jgi:hypothetical protein
MIHAHVAGELLAPPERRTSERGTDWLRLKLRCHAGGGHALVTAAVFDGELIERVAGLAPGDAVSLAGPLELRAWLDRDGNPCAGLGLVAHAVLTIRDGAARRDRRVIGEPKP